MSVCGVVECEGSWVSERGVVGYLGAGVVGALARVVIPVCPLETEQGSGGGVPVEDGVSLRDGDVHELRGATRLAGLQDLRHNMVAWTSRARGTQGNTTQERTVFRESRLTC